MPKRVSQNQINKIYEAHEKEMTTREAAEYAGVNPSTIFRYWNKKG